MPKRDPSRWQFNYGTVFEDRYGYNNGPRASPVIDGDRVFTMGAEGKLHCLDLASGKVVWKRDLRAEYKVPQDFFGTASTPLVEGQLLIVNVGAPGGPCVVGLDKTTGTRSVARRQGVGAELRVAGSCGRARTAARLRLRRRRVRSADRRADVDRSGERPSRLLVSLAQPQLRVGQRVLPGRLRQQGVRLGELSHRRRAARDSSRLHAQGAVDDAGVRAAFQHADLSRRVTCTGSMAATNPTRRSPASMRRPAKWCGARLREWNETLGGRQQPVSIYRGSLLAVDGQFLCLGELGHLLWMDLTPKGYKEISRSMAVSRRASRGGCRC